MPPKDGQMHGQQLLGGVAAVDLSQNMMLWSAGHGRLAALAAGLGTAGVQELDLFVSFAANAALMELRLPPLMALSAPMRSAAGVSALAAAFRPDAATGAGRVASACGCWWWQPTDGWARPATWAADTIPRAAGFRRHVSRGAPSWVPAGWPATGPPGHSIGEQRGRAGWQRGGRQWHLRSTVAARESAGAGGVPQ